MVLHWAIENSHRAVSRLLQSNIHYIAETDGNKLGDKLNEGDDEEDEEEDDYVTKGQDSSHTAPAGRLC